MSKLPKTLLLSRSIPPTVTGSSIIVSNLARQFSRDEMIVLGAYKFKTPPVQWLANYPKLRHVTFQFPDGTRGDRYVRWFQLPLLLLQVIGTAYAERCQALLTVYPDMIYLFAGYLASVITGKPLFVYFHNTLVEAKPHSSFARWLQARVFAHARYVFVMSDGMRRLYAKRYPDLQCEPLVHTFNEVIPSFDETAPALRQVSSPLKLVFSGNLNDSNRGAFEVIAKAFPDFPDAHLTIYTGTAHQFFKGLGLDGNRVMLDSVARDVLIEKLAAADILLLPHGFTETFAPEETYTIFPTKVIEYLLSGRPIVALLPADCFLADFLRQHECALLVTDPDPVQLNAAIRRVQQDAALRMRLVENAFRAVQEFYAPTVAARLREVVLQKLLVPSAAENPQPDTKV